MLDLLISILAPHDCLACGREGSLLCRSCLLKLPEAKERCHRCQKSSAGGLTCKKCTKFSRLHQLESFTLHQSIAQNLVWELKSSGTRAAAKIMASSIAGRIPIEENVIVSFAPTTTKRVRQRGYDQAELIAKELANSTGLPFQKTLSRIGKTHQVGSKRLERLSQLHSKFQVIHPTRVAGKSFLLVDDVTTTGATLSSAATALSRAGAECVAAITFTQA